MHSKYLNLINTTQILVPNSVQNYVYSSLTLFSQSKLFYFGFSKTQQSSQSKKKFAFKASKQQIPLQKANFYDILIKQWLKVQVKGKIPSLRENYLTIVFQNYILLYGGKSSPNKQLNDIYAFSIQKLHWKKLFSIEGPLISQNNLLIKLTQTKLMLINNQIWTFQLKNIKWQLNSNQLPGGIWENKGITLNNLNFTKLLNATVINQFVFIFYINQIQLKCSLLDFDHKEFRQVPISVQIKKQKNIKSSSLVKIKDSTKNQYAFLICQQLILFEIKTSGTQYKVQIKDKLLLKNDIIEKSQCFCLTETHLHIIINRKMTSYQLKIISDKQNIKQNFQNSSQKKIEKKIASNNQSIREQQHQQSLLIQKNSQNNKHKNKAGIYNSNQILQNSQLLRDLNLQQSRNYQQEQNNELIDQQNELIDQQIIKQRIQPLLAYQHLKRLKLQQKGRLLQKQIKQSQKFVLALISYSQQSQKAKHISKMKHLRQQLQTLWTKQIFFRKQIENQQKKIGMEKIIKNLK